MVEWIKLGICLFDNAFHVGYKVIVGSGSNSHTISRWAKVNTTGIFVAIVFGASKIYCFQYFPCLAVDGNDSIMASLFDSIAKSFALFTPEHIRQVSFPTTMTSRFMLQHQRTLKGNFPIFKARYLI